MADFQFDKELFEKAINKGTTDKDIFLMDDLSKIKFCVERALEVCLESTPEFSNVGL